MLMLKLTIPLLTAIVAEVASKTFTPCEFALELTKPEYGISVWRIPTIVCVAHLASNLNTSYTKNGHHGIFNIPSTWCTACSSNCTDFEDEDLTDDVLCFESFMDNPKTISSVDCSNPWTQLKGFNCNLDVPKPQIDYHGNPHYIRVENTSDFARGVVIAAALICSLSLLLGSFLTCTCRVQKYKTDYNHNNTHLSCNEISYPN